MVIGALRATPSLEGPYELSNALIGARGVGGQVAFNGRAVIIDRTGSASFIVHGLMGPTVIPLHDIKAVRLRPARAWSKGCLQLLRADAPARRGGAGDADSVQFDADQQRSFELLAKALREALKDQSVAVLVTSPDDPRERTRLAGLHEHGLITQDEFQRMAARRRAAKTPEAVVDTPRASASGSAAPRLGRTTREAREAFTARWAPDGGAQDLA